MRREVKARAIAYLKCKMWLRITNCTTLHFLYLIAPTLPVPIQSHLNVHGLVRLVLAPPDGAGHGDAAVDDLVRARHSALHRVAQALRLVTGPRRRRRRRLRLRRQLAVVVLGGEQGRVHLLRADDVDGFGMAAKNRGKTSLKSGWDCCPGAFGQTY